MRLFQNSGLYPTFRRLFDQRHGINQSFQDRRQAFLSDRFGASHFLQPVLTGAPEAFFTNGDDEILQRAWAKENGVPAQTSMSDILLAQIEAHRTEVFYNLDPVLYGSDFVRRLPGCVRHTLAWRAAPSPSADFRAYDRLLCNFPSILDCFRQQGYSVAYFTPAHDPIMDIYARQNVRPIDILFVGGYSPHHKTRAQTLEEVAKLSPQRVVRFHLDQSKMTRLAESPIGWVLPLLRYRRSIEIRRVSKHPVFGLELYDVLSQAKIVLNGAIDMAGPDRGNMRCYEAMGCGSLLVTDEGNYPKGMIPDKTMITYSESGNVAVMLHKILEDWESVQNIAFKGHLMVREFYNKERQWNNFKRIVESI